MKKICHCTLILIIALGWIRTSYGLDCKTKVGKIIELLNLQPLMFEGGYFKRTYVLNNNKSPKSPQATAILYLLRNGDKSLIHKLNSDEIYHFYSGDPVKIVILSPDGKSKNIILGQDILRGQQVQVIVPKNTWQGSYLLEGGCYSLLGTTMTPGFDIKKFTMGKKTKLLANYPQEKNNITYLTE